MYEVKINTVYRHFKGNFYFVHKVAADVENLEYTVVYQALYGNNLVYTRPVKEFLERVDPNASQNITGQEFRFMPIDDLKDTVPLSSLDTNILVEELKRRKNIVIINVPDETTYYLEADDMFPILGKATILII
jgi:hypothetical protein